MTDFRAVVVDDRRENGTRVRLVVTFDAAFIDAYRRNTPEPRQQGRLL